MSRQENFQEGKEIILATSSKDGQPNANIVISLGFIENKLLVANIQMKKTITNLKQNKNICVIGGYYRLDGIVEIFDNGEFFDLCVKKSPGFIVKNAILINVNKIGDLDKLETIG